MPLDRHHAFGNGPAAHRPSRWQARLWALAGLFSAPARLRRQMAEAWSQFDANAELPATCLLGPNAWCINCAGARDRIVLGERVVCRGLLRIENFGTGRIHASPHAYIGDDCLISCAASVEIGPHTLLAHGVQVFDNDTHPLDWRVRLDDLEAITRRKAAVKPVIASAPIRIGAHVWIGFHSIILKGVTIGDRSVVAAGSVVTKDVAADTLVAGNPARFIRNITAAERIESASTP